VYENKNQAYFKHIRKDIIVLVPEDSNRVLDIGCGAGEMLLELKRLGKASEVVGVDVVEMDQRSKLDDFINGDIEAMDLPYKEHFDVIICADLLEHLVDPWGALRKIKGYLKQDGRIILSIPNFRDFKTILKVIKGDVGYEDFGILDKTHLRFFAKKNIVELVEGAGLKVDRISYELYQKRKLLDTVTLGLFKDFLVMQYIVVALVA